MARRGYSVYRRSNTGPYYVAWTDGEGKRRIIKGSPNKSVAQEIGRAKASEADRVRAGVVDAAEVRASAAGREPVVNHLRAWKKMMLDKGNTSKHAVQSFDRAKRLLEIAAVSTVADLRAEPVQSAVATVGSRSSPQNARHYLTALRGFVRWCCDTGKLTINPIAAVKQPNVAGKTFKRTALSPEQLASLLSATATRRHSKTPFGNVDRAMYYRVMAYTGLRLSEARSLTPHSFNLAGYDPGITVLAAYSKNRREDRIPISRELAEIIKPWLAGRAAGKPVFTIAKHANLRRIFAQDCKAAGIVKREGEILGIHSLRRFFITSVVRAGGLAVGQDLARHSTPTLTKEYTDLVIADHRKGISGLPPLMSPQQEAKKTG